MTVSPVAAGALLPSHAPWIVEIGGWIAFTAAPLVLMYRWRKYGEPDVLALLIIGCFNMWWQEFYADWGACSSGTGPRRPAQSARQRYRNDDRLSLGLRTHRAVRPPYTADATRSRPRIRCSDLVEPVAIWTHANATFVGLLIKTQWSGCQRTARARAMHLFPGPGHHFVGRHRTLDSTEALLEDWPKSASDFSVTTVGLPNLHPRRAEAAFNR